MKSTAFAEIGGLAAALMPVVRAGALVVLAAALMDAVQQARAHAVWGVVRHEAPS